MRRAEKAAIQARAEDARAAAVLARLELAAAEAEVSRLRALIRHGEPLPFWQWRQACERLERARQAVMPAPAGG